MTDESCSFALGPFPAAFMLLALGVICSCLPLRTQSPSTQTPSAQANVAASDQLCGVTLTPAVLKLKHEVEQKVGPVDCVFFAFSGGPYPVYADERVHPKPVIRLNPARQNHLGDIAHELFHMKLITGGALENSTVNGPNPFDPASVEKVFSARDWLQDAMHHRLFYPEMRAMGFDPSSDERASIEAHLGNVRPNNFLGPTLNYIDACLLFNDEAFVRRYTAWLRGFDLDGVVNKGNIIVDSINKANPRTADQMAAELSNDLTILFWSGPQPPPSWFRFTVTPIK